MKLTDPIFLDPNKARAYLERTRWPNGPVCPHCSATKMATGLKGKTARSGLYQCNACRRQFTVTVGTVFERSKVPMNKWLLATYLRVSGQERRSIQQMGLALGVHYRTARFMCRRIDEATLRSRPSKA